MGSVTYLVTLYLQKLNEMKFLKFLLPLLLVASCSAFSLNGLFSSEDKAEELPAEESAVEETEEELEEEEEESEDDEEEIDDLESLEDEDEDEDEEEDEIEEEKNLDIAALE